MPASLPDNNNLAIVDDSDGAVIRPNLFNLNQKTVRLSPSGAGASQYTASPQPLGFDPAADQGGTPLTGLGDDDSRLIRLPFSFPFYGQRYDSVYVNSDGNLTFTLGDNASSPRSLGRALAGPPRILPFFEDLDPSQPSASVRFFSAADRAVLTWDGVPQWVQQGTGARQIFQVALYSDGRIDFHYQNVTISEAVVGIAPGGGQGGSTTADFSVGVPSPSSGAIAEIFSASTEMDFVTISQKFYRNHDDVYDYVVLYNNLGLTEGAQAFATERNIRNRVLGAGTFLRDNPIFDQGADYGSPLRLQSFLDMGPLSNYPVDPKQVVPIFASSRNTALSILGQETGHRFLAYARYLDPLSGLPSLGLLGRSNAHWSFYFNSDASVVEGNRIQDHGAGQSPRFLTTDTVLHYGPFDQYLMGLRSPADTPASFLVRSPSIGLPPSSSPQPGVSFDGTRQDVTVQMIVDAEGKRIPDSTVAQKHFNYAFVLLIQAGTQPSASDLAQLDRVRQAWEQFYDAGVDNRATANTSLVKQLRLSAWPAAGVLKGSPATATVAVAAPLAAKLDVLLGADSSVIAVPPSVTIPAGSASASFPITGNQLGVAELTARAGDPSYEVSQVLVQVREDGTQLHLDLVSGGDQLGGRGLALAQPIVWRVHDDNDLPFSGVAVSFAPSADGAVNPARGVTGLDGQVSVSWQLASAGAANALRASLDAAPSVSTMISATGGDRPVFALAGVVNAASFTNAESGTAAAVSPGGLYSIFGTALASRAIAASSFPLPTSLGSATVKVGGLAAPMLYVSPTQINFQAPFEIPSGATTSITVSTTAGGSGPVTLAQAGVHPGVFFDTATGLGAIVQNSDGALTSTRPARAGDFLQLYATGLGAVSPPALSGVPALVSPLARTTAQPQVTIAGQPATIAFSGLAPGFAGLYQVTLQVPSGVPSGRQSVVLTIGDRRANAVFVMIQ